MSIQPAMEPAAPAQHADESLEFVRFCYRRRRVAWPLLYDEMCAVAARGAYRGLGYPELADRGVTFCLSDMPRMVALAHRVMDEEPGNSETSSPPMTLSMVPAQS